VLPRRSPTRCSPRSYAGVVLTLLAALALFTPAGAEPPAAAPLRFLREYVPADRVAQWPVGPIPYRPTEAAEFERLIHLLDGAPRVGEGTAETRLEKARYQSRLVSDDLVDGSAELEISHSGSNSVLLPLVPCDLAIISAHWLLPPAAGKKLGEEVDAALGRDAEGRLAVLVERPGTLRLTWSIRGRRETADTWSVDLDLPRATTSTLEFDLPIGQAPKASAGVLSGSSVGADKRYRRWTLELGGEHRLGLRVSPDQVVDESQALSSVRQSFTYDFSPRGVDLTAALELEAVQQPLRRVELALDPGLEILSARLDDIPLTWTTPQGPETGERRVFVDLPEPLIGGRKLLRVTAWTPVVTQQKWRLPGLHPRGLSWLSGRATLRVPAPLAITQIEPIRLDGQLCGRQVETNPLPLPAAGESLVFDYYNERAALMLELGRRSQLIETSSGSTLDWSIDEIAGMTMIDVELSHDKLFQLEADVPAAWTIDAVATEPFEALADWSRQSSGGATDRLTIRLEQSLARGRPLRLAITGRLLRPPLGEPVKLSDLEMVSLRGARKRDRLLALRTSGPYRFQVQEAEGLKRRTRDELDAGALARLSGPSFDLLLSPPAGPSSAAVALFQETPRYQADVSLDLMASDGPLWESYRIRCTPESARDLERVLVYFPEPTAPSPDKVAPVTPAKPAGSKPSGPPADELAGMWTLDDSQQSDGLTARRLPPESLTSAGLRPGGELWELSLRVPRREPFELRAVRQMPWPGESQRASLPQVPEARRLRGTVVVRTLGRMQVEVESRGLRSIPLPARNGALLGAPRAAFRTPLSADDASQATGDVVISRRTPPKELPGALVWLRELEIRYVRQVDTQYLATFRVQNTNLPSVMAQLPARSQLLGVWVDREPLTGIDLLGKSNEASYLLEHSIPLPEGKRFVTVRLHYQLAYQGKTQLHLDAARLDLPTLDTRVTLWLPPGYEVVDADPNWRVHGLADLTLSSRLFGPFGRSRDGRPFDPFSRQAWEHLWGMAASADVAVNQAGALRRRLSESYEASQYSGMVAWGQLLSEAAHDADPSHAALPLLIDVPSLALEGIYPAATVMPHSPSTLLEDARLELLAHPSALVLTTHAAAARYRLELSLPTTDEKGHPVSRTIRPGVLAARVNAAASLGGSSALMNVAAWGLQLQPVWTHEDPPVEVADPSSGFGWNAYRLDGNADSITVSVVRAPMRDTIAWGAFLMALAVGWWCGRRARLAALLGLAVAVALVVSPANSPIASAVVLGLMFSAVARFVYSPPPVRSPHASSSTVIRSNKVALGAIALLAMATLLATRPPESRQLLAAEPALPARPETIYRVLIPIDADRKPVPGGLYQVPLDFYRELLARAQQVAGQPRGWLLGAAEYRGALVREIGGTGFSVPLVTASYALRTFEAGARVELPLVRSEVDIPLESIELDGRQASAQWDESGKKFYVDVPDPGLYRLEMTLRPRMRTVEGAAGFEFAIPPIAQSRLEIALPIESPAIEAPGARGPTDHDPESQVLTAPLGPISTLSVRWREDDPAGGAGPKVEVDQLAWLKVQPGSTQIDVQLRYRVVHGSVRRLYVAADPRLARLRDWQSPGLRDWQKRDLAGHPRAYVLNFSRPMTGQFTVEASFSWEGTSGAGNLRLPRLEPLWAEVTRNWLAVSVHPDLEVVSSQGAEVNLVDFTSAWGTTDLKPRPVAVFNLAGGGSSAWRMATRPKEPTQTAEQTLELTVGRDSADIRFEAHVITRDAPSFQHRIQTPAKMQVEQVTVEEEESERPVRWTRTPEGMLTVFLDAPAGTQNLVVTGTLPVATPGTLVLPQMRMQNARLIRSRVRVFRRANVLIAGSDTLPAEEQSSGAGARLVLDLDEPLTSAVAGTPAAPERKLTLRPSRPEVRAEQATTVFRRDNRWFAQLEFHVRDVRKGVVDVLRFDAPPNWRGPIEIVPNAPYEWIDLPGEGKRQLVVRPAGAIDGAYRVLLRSPLGIAGDSRLLVPRIVPRNVESLEQYLILPTQFEQHQAVWDHHGIEPAELPHDFETPASKNYEVHRVVDPNFRASLESIDLSAPQARVRLADITAICGRDRRAWGVASFDLEPAGQSSCVVAMPGDGRVLAFQIAGATVDPLPEGTGGWRVPLGPGQFPQRLEVAFTVELQTSEQGGPDVRELRAPQILNWPVERTLWNVHGLPRGARLAAAKASDIRSPRDQELERVRNLIGLIDDTALQVSEEPVEELRDWYVPWSTRLRDATLRLRQQIVAFPLASDNEQVQAQLQKLLGEQQYWTQLLGESGSSRETGTPSASLVSLAVRTRTGGLRTSAEGSLASLDVELPQSAAGTLDGRLMTALAVLLATGLVTLGLARRWVAGWFRRWSHGAVATAGILWWMFLEPSLLGWLLVALALVRLMGSTAPRPIESPSTPSAPRVAT